MTTATATDLMLIARCQEGDRESLDTLVRMHHEAAYQYAMRLTGCRDEAADVVAESFIRVFRSVDKFKGDSSFDTWLYRIVMNCFLDMRKKSRRRRLDSLDAPKVKELAAPPESSPFNSALGGEKSRKLTRAIELIPKSQRAALALVHTGKYTYEEIAKMLGVPMGTVKSRIFTAKRTIRKHLVNEIDCFDLF